MLKNFITTSMDIRSFNYNLNVLKANNPLNIAKINKFCIFIILQAVQCSIECDNKDKGQTLLKSIIGTIKDCIKNQFIQNAVWLIGLVCLFSTYISVVYIVGVFRKYKQKYFN
jgi:hypothetical protein